MKILTRTWNCSLIRHKSDRLLGLLPMIVGHDSFHELVEEGDCESSIPVAGAVDHSLVDELASRWCEGSDFSIQLMSDIT